MTTQPDNEGKPITWKISKILLDAVQGHEPRYRLDGCIRWGLVEKEMHQVIDAEVTQLRQELAQAKADSLKHFTDNCGLSPQECQENYLLIEAQDLQIDHLKAKLKEREAKYIPTSKMVQIHSDKLVSIHADLVELREVKAKLTATQDLHDAAMDRAEKAEAKLSTAEATMVDARNLLEYSMQFYGDEYLYTRLQTFLSKLSAIAKPTQEK